jgi:ubiquinone/menaquinone biosynthesis C-methylase UbiE
MRELEVSTAESWRLGGAASYGSYAIEKRMRTILQHVSLDGREVLDLGCGNGSYTREIARRASFVIGLDAQLPNLTSFETPIPRFVGVGEALPFSSESFDVVTMIEVLEHTTDDRAVIVECYRVLRPGGYLALFVPNKLYPMESHPCHIKKYSIGRNIPFASWLPDSVRKHICFARIYSRRRLLGLVRAAGFGVEKVGYIYPPADSFPLPQSLRNVYRSLSWRLEESPLRVFGVSIFALFRKNHCMDSQETPPGT